MKKNGLFMLFIALFLLAACGNESVDSTAGEKETVIETNESKEQTITYLNKEYTVTSNPTKIVTASQEAMEDAAILGVKPIGAIATGGMFSEYLGDSMSEATEIGEKTQPSIEKLLQLEPDVILGTSKFQPEVAEKLTDVAPMIPISHISTNWKDNLLVLAELTDKKEEANQIIADYESSILEVKENVSGSMEDQQVLMIRIRGGNLFIYSRDIYFNPVLYQDLGLPVPEAVKAAKSQEMITLEKLAEINPDYLFVQFEEQENADAPDRLKELQENAIWKSMNAVENENVFVNAVSPLAAGGTAWSKTEFINVIKETLAQ
ncbi:ABC transporter substrate-binding protein [Metabacillus halosaccharovorans]|uniref:ABC transporter substrate-binding protein n=1 Tax=Metabacillus halosaccharovorans TaxID=930124 RepID=A0ABT3DBK3_9BACI|nr:ABC transporter substrate-binding protein [Metabacillus halosaccharovorans]MCV9884433.1 ABC transporter substrate-binding protein [Metabacillus halosaccharovorans]